MDREELKKNIAKYYKRLPAHAQQVFSSEVWLEELNTISSAFGLSEDQKKDLMTETMLALLAMIDLDEYEYFVMNSIGVEKEKAYQMLVSIDQKILASVRTELVDVYDRNSKETDDLEDREDDSSFTDTHEDFGDNIDFIVKGGK